MTKEIKKLHRIVHWLFVNMPQQDFHEHSQQMIEQKLGQALS